MEKWKAIPGTRKNYEVSNAGRFKSLDRVSKLDGHIRPGRILKTAVNRRGYITIAIMRKTRISHRLVAKAFIPNPENKPEVNHKNGIKADNRVENLEWATRSENQIHAFRNGIAYTKVSEDAVLFIRENFKSMGKAALAKKFNICGAYVYSIAIHKDKSYVEGPVFQTNSPIPSKAVGQYDKSGNFIRRHESIKSAAKAIGVNIGRVQEILKGQRVAVHGFVFKRMHDNGTCIDNKKREKKKIGRPRKSHGPTIASIPQNPLASRLASTFMNTQNYDGGKGNGGSGTGTGTGGGTGAGSGSGK